MHRLRQITPLGVESASQPKMIHFKASDHAGRPNSSVQPNGDHSSSVARPLDPQFKRSAVHSAKQEAVFIVHWRMAWLVAHTLKWSASGPRLSASCTGLALARRIRQYFRIDLIGTIELNQSNRVDSSETAPKLCMGAESDPTEPHAKRGPEGLKNNPIADMNCADCSPRL